MTPSTTSPQDPNTLAEAAAASLAERTGVGKHDLAVVLGSGWRPAAEEFGTPETEVDMDDLAGFEAPSAVGHSGKIWSITMADKKVLVLLGRTHGYEGRGLDPVVHGVRTVAKAGCGSVVLTNAAGGLREGMSVGQAVLISDHLNMTTRSPLVGANFVDLTDLYSPRLRGIARTIDSSLEEGVYAAMPGPHFETPAEIRMLRTLGADLVGMSTVPEAIAARAEGTEVFGLSLVTNLAAGVTGEPLNHQEVLEAGKAAATRMGKLLKELVERS